MSLNRKTVKTSIYFLLSLSFFYAGFAFAQTNGIGDIANHISGTFGSFATLITAGSYLAGIAFAFLAVLEFKTYRDNPGQKPLSKPISYLFIAIAFLFLPYIIQQTGKTVLGSGATAGSITGTTDITG